MYSYMQGYWHFVPQSPKPTLETNAHGISLNVSHNKFPTRVKVKEQWLA
jgi:hypothetical protein